MSRRYTTLCNKTLVFLPTVPLPDTNTLENRPCTVWPGFNFMENNPVTSCRSKLELHRKWYKTRCHYPVQLSNSSLLSRHQNATESRPNCSEDDQFSSLVSEVHLHPIGTSTEQRNTRNLILGRTRERPHRLVLLPTLFAPAGWSCPTCRQSEPVCTFLLDSVGIKCVLTETCLRMSLIKYYGETTRGLVFLYFFNVLTLRASLRTRNYKV